MRVDHRRLTTALAMGSYGLSPPWRGFYQTRNQLAMALEHGSPRELFWWFVRTTRFCYGALHSADRPAERTRLRAQDVWHTLRRVSGRTFVPTSADSGRPG